MSLSSHSSNPAPSRFALTLRFWRWGLLTLFLLLFLGLWTATAPPALAAPPPPTGEPVIAPIMPELWLSLIHI